MINYCISTCLLKITSCGTCFSPWNGVLRVDLEKLFKFCNVLS
uniref:Uncharacterized protein n=1 Tax=Lepeophtheirus salmonis TaxID=72036 RepID=A0A0K2V0N7_LEPSM